MKRERLKISTGAEGGPVCKIYPLFLTPDHYTGPQGDLKKLGANFKYGPKSCDSRCRTRWLPEIFTIVRLVSNTSNPNILGTRNMNISLFEWFEFVFTP